MTEAREGLTNVEVEHVAHLARLELAPGEAAQLAEQLGEILRYVSHLQELDTSGVDAAFQVFPLENVFRDDTVRESLPASAILANAPERRDDYFLMPRILDGGSFTP